MSNKTKNSLVRKLMGIGFSWAQANELGKGAQHVVKNANGIIYIPNQTANGATFAQAGNVVTVTTTAHNVPATVHNGFRIYSPGFATATVGALLPAGIYDNFQRTGATTYTFEVPAAYAVPTTQTGTMTTGVLTEITLDDLTYTVPAGALGIAGKLRATAAIACNNSAGAKVLNIKLDTAVISTVSVTTAIFGEVPRDILYNNNNAARQNRQSTGTASTIDTAVAKNIVTTVTLAALQDYIAVQNVLVDMVV